MRRGAVAHTSSASDTARLRSGRSPGICGCAGGAATRRGCGGGDQERHNCAAVFAPWSFWGGRNQKSPSLFCRGKIRRPPGALARRAAAKSEAELPANQKRALRRDQQDGDQKGLRPAHQKAESEAGTEAATEGRIRRPAAPASEAGIRTPARRTSERRQSEHQSSASRIRRFGQPKPQIRRPESESSAHRNSKVRLTETSDSGLRSKAPLTPPRGKGSLGSEAPDILLGNS